MSILLFGGVIAFAFFAQSLLGFGGGLIAIPILSLFMPVQDVVTVMILYQFSMGLLIFKTRKDTNWVAILKMVPSMLIATILGIFLLKYLDGDAIRIVLALYIILHLARSNTNFDPLGRLIHWGGAHLAGFLGGGFNAMIGGGGPAFILYLKDKAASTIEFRANVMAILFLSNIPRIIGSAGTNMITTDLILFGLYAYPGFLVALFLGHKLHDKIPQHIFYILVNVILTSTALSLILKTIIT